MRETIYIFHETGNKNHYRALVDREQTTGDIKLVFREFSLLKFFARGIARNDMKLAWKQVVNLCFMVRLIFLRNKKIIVGIAPYDYRLLIFYPFLKKNKYFYHSSHTSWGYVNHIKHFLAETAMSKKTWEHFINDAAGIFCATEKVESEICRHYANKKTVVVNHAVKKEYTENIEPGAKEKINCLFVGRVEKSKGIYLILKLIERLPAGMFAFKFAGKGSLDQEVKNFAATRADCEVLGYKQDPALRKIYEEADVLMAPSLRTGTFEEFFGIVIIEAMSRGVVPISTDHSGPKEVIHNTIDGFVFSETEYVTAAEKLLLQLNNDRNYLNQMRKNAFETGQSYSPSAIYKRWNSLLDV